MSRPVLVCLVALAMGCSSPLGPKSFDDGGTPCPACDAGPVDASPGPPSAARIAPPASNLQVGAQIQFTVWLVDQNETLVPTDSKAGYISSNGNVLTVDASGSAMALAAGTSTVTGSLDGLSADAVIDVIGPGAPDAGTGPGFDPAACCPSVANSADATDLNMCYAGGPSPPTSADPDCPMVFSGGYCANPSGTDFSSGDWDRGYNEAHEYCCSFHPGAAGC